MPVRFEFVEDHGLLVVTYRGTVTRDEFIGAYEAAYADPRYARCIRELVDHRDATRIEQTVDDLRYVNRLTRRRLHGREEGLRTAVLAPQDVSYGTARIYAAFADDSNERVSVVRTLQDAADWLGLDLQDFVETDVWQEPENRVSSTG